MGEFFAKDWKGSPFVLFGTAHLIGLGCVALAIIAIVYFGKKASPQARRNIRYGLAGVLLSVEASWHLWNLFTGQWTVLEHLPLHLCSFLIWLSAFMIITKNYTIYEFSYLLGIAGALQALLTPDAGIYGFPHFRFFQVLLSHGALITCPIYLTLVEGFRPTKASVLRVIKFSMLYMIAVFIFNLIIGSNYLFIGHKPETASLIDVLPPWPWYVPIIAMLGLISIMLFYAPFAIQDYRARTANNK
ncbi:MAG: TIGR02206 family membrane protein [Anaerolineae bacterium]|nr:TIGR02206 family membrane protein [Anaerolineae bacterium]